MRTVYRVLVVLAAIGCVPTLAAALDPSLASSRTVPALFCPASREVSSPVLIEKSEPPSLTAQANIASIFGQAFTPSLPHCKASTPSNATASKSPARPSRGSISICKSARSKRR